MRWRCIHTLNDAFVMRQDAADVWTYSTLNRDSACLSGGADGG